MTATSGITSSRFPSTTAVKEHKTEAFRITWHSSWPTDWADGWLTATVWLISGRLAMNVCSIKHDTAATNGRSVGLEDWRLTDWLTDWWTRDWLEDIPRSASRNVHCVKASNCCDVLPFTVSRCPKHSTWLLHWMTLFMGSRDRQRHSLLQVPVKPNGTKWTHHLLSLRVGW